MIKSLAKQILNFRKIYAYRMSENLKSYFKTTDNIDKFVNADSTSALLVLTIGMVGNVVGLALASAVWYILLVTLAHVDISYINVFLLYLIFKIVSINPLALFVLPDIVNKESKDGTTI